MCRRTIFAVAVVLCAAPAVRSGGVPVRLRNDLTPGSLAVYHITIQGQRTTQQRRWKEVLNFKQTGRLTLLVLNRPKKKRARRAWMMELDEPVVVSLLRDGQVVDETFSAKSVGLPPRAVQLRVSRIDGSRAAATPAGGSLVQRAGMLLALDFAHWPDGLAAAGESWEAEADRDELRGVWTLRYDTTEGRGARRLAVGSFNFEGALAGPFANAAIVDSAEGTWKWRVAKRSLDSSTARIVLRYGEREQPRTLGMKVALEVERLDRLPAPSVKNAIEELTQVSRLADALTATDSEKAIADLETFVAAHPKSVWLPVVSNLLERTAFEHKAFGKMDDAQLRDVLVKLVTRWQMAAMAGHPEPLQPIRATFREIMEGNRTALHALADDSNANVRAIAAFCVAFGDKPEDLDRVVASCRDEEARVRAWAAYGLAERRDETVRPDVLEALLGDEDAKVRQRACMVVAGCVRRDAPSRSAFMKRLVRLVRSDPDHAVRGRAAEAIDALAIVEDLPVLIEIEKELDVPPARRQIEFTIRRLGGSPEDIDD